MKNEVSKLPQEGAGQTEPRSGLDLYQLVIDQSPDAVILANLEGKVQIWNDAATELFGYGLNDAIGQSIDIIIPDRLRHAHWNGFDRAIASGHTKHGKRALRTRAVHQTGRKLYATLAFSIVKDPNGKVIGAMATARESNEKSDPVESHSPHQ